MNTKDARDFNKLEKVFDSHFRPNKPDFKLKKGVVQLDLSNNIEAEVRMTYDPNWVYVSTNIDPDTKGLFVVQLNDLLGWLSDEEMSGVKISSFVHELFLSWLSGRAYDDLDGTTGYYDANVKSTLGMVDAYINNHVSYVQFVVNRIMTSEFTYQIKSLFWTIS